MSTFLHSVLLRSLTSETTIEDLHVYTLPIITNESDAKPHPAFGLTLCTLGNSFSRQHTEIFLLLLFFLFFPEIRI